VTALNDSGIPVKAPKGAIYVWAPVPEGQTSVDFCQFLLDEVGVVLAPGSGYGHFGEGFVRFSLTLADDRVDEGMERVVKAMKAKS
jgi:LL-diaminopimelate aminotransferase